MYTSNHKRKMQFMYFETMLALFRLIYKHYKQGFLQNNGVNTNKSILGWLP